MSSENKRKIAVGGALILFVVFLLVPRIPKAKSDAIPDQAVHVDEAVQEAVDLVNGEQPMQGILKLRSILEEDPQNIDAAWHLGQFSVQTGQYEKAAERFEQVLANDSEGRYPETTVYLGKTYATLGDNARARELFTQYTKTSSDPETIRMVEALIVELDKSSATLNEPQ